MTGSKKDSTSSFSLPNDMTRSRCAQDAILPDQELLHTVRSSNLGNQLYHLGVIESSISTNDEKAALGAFGDGKEDAGNERLAVVGFLEDDNLFPETRPVRTLLVPIQ